MNKLMCKFVTTTKKKKIPNQNLDTACPAGIPCKTEKEKRYPTQTKTRPALRASRVNSFRLRSIVSRKCMLLYLFELSDELPKPTFNARLYTKCIQR